MILSSFFSIASSLSESEQVAEFDVPFGTVGDWRLKLGKDLLIRVFPARVSFTSFDWEGVVVGRWFLGDIVFSVGETLFIFPKRFESSSIIPPVDPLFVGMGGAELDARGTGEFLSFDPPTPPLE